MKLDQILKDKTSIAFFSKEMNFESPWPTYSRGLGILASDIIRSAADLELPLVVLCLCAHISIINRT